MTRLSQSASVTRRGGLFASVARRAAALGLNLVGNLAQWCSVLARPPRARPPAVPESAIIIVFLALPATVASMFFIDRAATDWAQHLSQDFKSVFDQISNAGESGWLLIPFGCVVLVLAALTAPDLSRLTQGVLGAVAARFGFLFLAIGAPSLFDTILKRLIGRARPYADLDGSPFTYMPFAWRSAFASLPSGHAATAGAAAFAIGAIWPRSRPVMWLYALIILFSRVVVMAHHPSDVIAGLVVGVVGAAWLRRLFAARCLVFSPHDLAVYPGPSMRRFGRALRSAVLALGGRPRALTGRPIEPGRNGL
jgi:membrane-associated phospholipid phosphatase